MTVRAPFASATAIVVEARSTSIIATTRPWTSCVPRCSAPYSTSMRTLRRLLHQLRLPLQELRVHVAALESGVLHDAREEGDGGRRPLDDEGFQCEPHLRQRLFTVASLTDDLGDHRIVERRHRVAGVDVRVETHTVAARRMEGHDATRGRLEVSVRILGVDATLDDVAAKRWQLVNAERMACGDTDLLLHEIDPGQHLRHRMLDLDPRVHLHEVERAVLVEQHLDRAGAHVVDRFRSSDRRVAHPAPQVRRHRRARRLLDELLMPPLYRAVAFTQMDHAAVLVAEDLELDVPRPHEVLLDVHVAV